MQPLRAMKGKLNVDFQKFGKIKSWFSNRMPVGDEIRLNQRSTYILPTKAGFLLMVIIFIMMVAATNYQNNLAFLLTFLILSIGIVSIVFTFKNLQGLQFRVGKTNSVFSGDVLTFNFFVASQFGKPHSGIGVGFDKNSLYYMDISEERGSSALELCFSLPFTTKQRGPLHLPRIYTTSVFPFGLLKVWSWFQFQSPVLIYPEPICPPENVWVKSNSDDDGDSSQLNTNDELEFEGIKEFKPGDPFSRVDWKSTAKERGLYLKVFSNLSRDEQSISWESFSSSSDELRLSYLTYLVCEAARKQEAFSLTLPNHSVAMNSGEVHLNHCLSLLALYPKVEQ